MTPHSPPLSPEMVEAVAARDAALARLHTLAPDIARRAARSSELELEAIERAQRKRHPGWSTRRVRRAAARLFAKRDRLHR